MFILTIIIIAQFLNLSFGSPRISGKIARKRIDNLNYRLPENVFPEHYTLKMAPQFKNGTFTGYVKILIHVKISTDNITLHQKNLNITKEKIYLTTKDDLVINIKDAGPSGRKKQEFYTITFPKILNESTYYLHIPEFYGVLTNPNVGFYHSNYTDEKGELREIALTAFEPAGARFAFPCFDEPSFRAKFKMYIVRPQNYHSVANAKLIKSIELNNSLYEDEFEDTLSMSTYLVQFIVSEMKLSTSPDSSKFRVLARPEVLKEGYEKNSLKLSIKILKALETYLNVNYTLNKTDQAVIPDEAFKHPNSETLAMESWGLITYKETYFSITPETPTILQVYLSLTIAHELAHQWFGNLVTVKWWRYLWLKEGFASFLQARILDKIKPEWKLMESFIAKEKQLILEIDSSVVFRDMNQDAGTRKEITSLYDPIAYTKSACVVHMLETIMTPNIFKHGLTNYLQEMAFKAAVPMDLYRNLQKSLVNFGIKLPQNLSIGDIMSTWVSQPGYPLVYVQRDYDKNQEIVKLTQSRYVQPEGASSQPTNWYIPINYASKSNPNFNDTRFSNWLLKPKDTITINNLKRDDWLIFNKQEAYYYRVNYDIENWKLIAKALKENYRNIHVLNRAQLIDDSFHLAKINKIDVSIPLEISSYLHEEDYYFTHSVFLRNIVDIEKYSRGTNVQQKFRNYVILSLKRSYHRLGINSTATDTLIDKLHRIEIVKWMCEFNYGECRANSWKIFEQWRKYNTPPDMDLIDETTCNAIRYGNEDDWNYLYDNYEVFHNTEMGVIWFGWLACTENASILLHFMSSSLNPSQKYSIKDVVTSISSKGLVGVNATKHYVAEHFNVLISIFGNTYTEGLLKIIISQFTTQVDLDQLIKLLPKNITESARLTKLFNKSRLKISQKEKYTQQIYKFFQSYKPPNDPDQGRSDGNLGKVIPNIFACILYSLIIFVMVAYNN